MSDRLHEILLTDIKKTSLKTPPIKNPGLNFLPFERTDDEFPFPITDLFSLRGQIDRIGAQFCVCMFLDSRNKSFKLCWNDQRKRKNKRRSKGASLLRNPAYNSQNT